MHIVYLATFASPLPSLGKAPFISDVRVTRPDRRRGDDSSASEDSVVLMTVVVALLPAQNIILLYKQRREKTVFGIPGQVRHKLACAATEDG